MSTEIVKAGPTDLEHSASTILDVIERVASNPAADVEKLERLLAIQQTVLADQRRTAYMAAMSRLQAALPQVTKSGTIFDGNGKVRSTFAKIEDVDVAIRPLCASEGFSFSLDSEPAGTSGTKFTLKMSHRDGHAETLSTILPVAAPPGCSATQGVGSTLSYARRYLLMMHLNLVTRDVDNDGQGESAPITPEQVEQLRRELAETKSSVPRFLLWLKRGSLEEVTAEQLKPALMAIDETRKKMGGAK